MITFRQQLSTTLFEAFELEIMVNCLVHTWLPVSHETCILAYLDWSRDLPPCRSCHRYVLNTICYLVAAQLYLSCRFSSADYPWLQVSNPCGEILSTAFNNNKYNNHRLRGSASTVLTATGQVNGKWRILTPHRIETHEPTATKFRTIARKCLTMGALKSKLPLIIIVAP